MTWETEELSDLDGQSQSQMTTDTYGNEHGNGNGNEHETETETAAIIWSDDPEQAYFRSMIDAEDRSLIGDSTINEMLNERQQDSDLDEEHVVRTTAGTTTTTTRRTQQVLLGGEGAGEETPYQSVLAVDSSGLSYYDTDAEDDTIGGIEPDANARGWFAARRSAANAVDDQMQASTAGPSGATVPSGATGSSSGPHPYHMQQQPQPQQQAQAQPPTPLPPTAGWDPKSPLSALSPQDKAGEGQGPLQSFAVPNRQLVPTGGPQNPTGNGRQPGDFPGFIFVTSGGSAAVQTRKGSNEEKQRQTQLRKEKEKEKEKQLAVDHGSNHQHLSTEDPEECKRRRRYCYFKVGIAVIMVALIVGIGMLSIVFKQKRDERQAATNQASVPSPTFAPIPFAATVAPMGSTSPTVLPVAPSPTTALVVPTVAPTQSPIAVEETQTASPTLRPTLRATPSPLADIQELLLAEFPLSALALQDPTSPQYRAMEWLLTPSSSSPTGRGRRRRRRRQLQELDWRAVQQWVLVTLYFATNGDMAWRSNTGWLELPDECEWAFVVCTDEGRIQDLVIQENDVQGQLPLELGYFGNALRLLSLNSNAVTGTLPTTLGMLDGLTRLTIQRNQLTGTLPTELGNLASLRFLALNRNPLNGPLPTQMGNILSLRTLDLALTDVSGTLPTELGNLLDLELVSMGSTKIRGTIPDSMGDLEMLSKFKVARTNLSGVVPSGMCLRNWETLKVDCQEVDCSCCTVCCVDESGCSGPTPETTPSPTRFPTVRPTRAPAQETTTNPTTRAPTRPPTAAPTDPGVEVTPQPTPNPTPDPTVILTPAPTSCDPSVRTELDCYQSGDDVTVSFDNCDMQADDWVGVYALEENFDSLPEPIAWVWTSGTQQVNSRVPVQSGSVTFFDARGRGSFRVVLARDGQLPYEAYAVSEIWRLAFTC